MESMSLPAQNQIQCSKCHEDQSFISSQQYFFHWETLIFSTITMKCNNPAHKLNVYWKTVSESMESMSVFLPNNNNQTLFLPNKMWGFTTPKASVIWTSCSKTSNVKAPSVHPNAAPPRPWERPTCPWRWRCRPWRWGRRPGRRRSVLVEVMVGGTGGASSHEKDVPREPLKP